MLCYLGTGQRDYAKKPVTPNQRPYWEFQAVISGHIAMTDTAGAGVLKNRHLWLSSPGYPHGWTGKPANTAEVIVFHFNSLPEPLRQRVSAEGYLETPLATGQIDRLRHLSGRVAQYWYQPGPDMLLRHEHALLELSLLVYEAVEKRAAHLRDIVYERVRKAMKWYADNMRRNPGLEAVALSTGTSQAHLRRHFHDVMQASPKKVFDQIRFQRAIQLMADPGTKLSTVSEDCGFESPSAFSRAFKNKFGTSPVNWRS